MCAVPDCIASEEEGGVVSRYDMVITHSTQVDKQPEKMSLLLHEECTD